MSDLLNELDRCSRLLLPIREALAQIDSVQRRIYFAIADAYGDDYYAKLVALKLCNFAAAKYHYINRHTAVASSPVTLMHDPANACQLRCPSCVHTDNKDFARPFLWPKTIIRPLEFAPIMERLGPFALNVVYYNYGEPLLNKALPELLKVSNGYGLTSAFSTNLSLEFDVARFVAAGPGHLILSIDGITQETYSRYRKRGRLDLVLDNVRRLVQAKRELGVRVPYLSWRMLTFEHNLHEVDGAIEMAREFGVNEIQVVTPFDVSLDDPTIRVARSDRSGTLVFNPASRSPSETLARVIRTDSVVRAFETSWVERCPEGADQQPHAASSTCMWLYWNLTVDAAQRLMPCCMAPTTEHHLVYGHVSDRSGGLFNSNLFRLARESFADRDAFDRHAQHLPLAERPFCAGCQENPILTYGSRTAVGDIEALDFLGTLKRQSSVLERLADWA